VRKENKEEGDQEEGQEEEVTRCECSSVSRRLLHGSKKESF